MYCILVYASHNQFLFRDAISGFFQEFHGGSAHSVREFLVVSDHTIQFLFFFIEKTIFGAKSSKIENPAHEARYFT